MNQLTKKLLNFKYPFPVGATVNFIGELELGTFTITEWIQYGPELKFECIRNDGRLDYWWYNKNEFEITK